MAGIKFLGIFLIPIFLFALEGKVISVTDGDTIKILTSKRRQIKVRLYGIDAKRYLADLIAGKTVQIEGRGKDRYKRVLGIVYLDGKDVNEILVLNGYAWAFTKYSKIYESQERQARSKGLGLWRDKNPIKPEIWRKIYK